MLPTLDGKRKGLFRLLARVLQKFYSKRASSRRLQGANLSTVEHKFMTFYRHPGEMTKQHLPSAPPTRISCLALTRRDHPAEHGSLAGSLPREWVAGFGRETSFQYPRAEKIRLVQDNWNTHNLSSLYEGFPAAQAFALGPQVEFRHTPKSLR